MYFFFVTLIGNFRAQLLFCSSQTYVPFMPPNKKGGSYDGACFFERRSDLRNANKFTEGEMNAANAPFRLINLDHILNCFDLEN